MSRVLQGVIRAYAYLVSPWLGNNCRFVPSCSEYARQALHRYGAVKGLRLSAWRLLRCHPWCAGGHDPIP